MVEVMEVREVVKEVAQVVAVLMLKGEVPVQEVVDTVVVEVPVVVREALVEAMVVAEEVELVGEVPMPVVDMLVGMVEAPVVAKAEVMVDMYPRSIRGIPSFNYPNMDKKRTDNSSH
ncbi:hypothetical protein CDL12_08298 [Handroanthus impetiginosus]|uniref:Uncharacterized protein n=1 Tax=Handroanthus impetiginosus TaxID=429701 RepID=A0A2G9HNJ6_9LAMI|nr:hypothetical protein CDL12_08298 [Handroanthus impetiginosus]